MRTGARADRGTFEGTLEAMARLLKDELALTTFGEVAVHEDLWQEAQADPALFFRARGVEIPEILDMALQSHESMRPWPPMAADLELVTVRCWWVWGKQDPDGDYLPPTRFCLEVPQVLLSYLHR